MQTESTREGRVIESEVSTRHEKWMSERLASLISEHPELAAWQDSVVKKTGHPVLSLEASLFSN